MLSSQNIFKGISLSPIDKFCITEFCECQKSIEFFQSPASKFYGRRSARHRAKIGVHKVLADRLSEEDGTA